MEYLQQLQNKILAVNVTLLENTGDSQIVGTKHKENILENKKKQ